MSRLFYPAACAMGVLLGSAAGCRAQEEKPVKADPAALELVGEVAKTYQGLSFYADNGRLHFEVYGKSGEKLSKQELPLKASFARPNKLNLDLEELLVRSDGKTMMTSVVPLKRYSVVDAPKVITTRTFEGGPVEAVLSNPIGIQSVVLLKLLFESDAKASILKLTDGIALAAPDEKLEGKTYKTVILPLDGPDFKLLIDPETKLLERVDTVFSVEDVKELELGSKAKEVRIYWSAGGPSSKAISDSVFALKPPSGYEKIAKLEDLVPAGGGDADFAEFKDGLVGKPSPDFTLTVLAGPGKTQKLSKADLKGKVVILDFWATWCGPCLKELPELQKYVKRLVSEKKNVVVIALSQDEGDAEKLADIRKLVEKTLADNKIAIEQPPVGMIALDPEGTTGKLFSPPGIPAIVVLDAQGVIRTVHVGFSDKLIDSLSREIDTLLSGKPLVEKDKPAPASGEK